MGDAILCGHVAVTQRDVNRAEEAESGQGHCCTGPEPLQGHHHRFASMSFCIDTLGLRFHHLPLQHVLFFSSSAYAQGTFHRVSRYTDSPADSMRVCAVQQVCYSYNCHCVL